MSNLRQQGTALVTALLIVALASTAATAMLKQQHVSVRRAGNIINAEQASLYVQSGEAWVAQLLIRDQASNQTDSFADDWARLLEPFPIEDGAMQARVEDLQGRFNLNNLLTVEGTPSASDRENFQRLLGLLELDPDLLQPISDWIDPDINASFPGGAEDNEYLGLDRPYRTSNLLFVSTSELLLIKGVTPEIYAQLAPFVTALPERTTVNINTASAHILAASIAGLSLAEAESIVSARPPQGYADIKTFLAEPLLNGRKAEGLAVSSAYFNVGIDVQLGRHRARMQSIIARTQNVAGRIQVIRRSRAEL